MTKPKFTDISCSSCGRKIGKKPGVQVILGMICDDPLCFYQSEPQPNVVRDSYVVAAALDGLAASQIAFANDMSRQRVYQIVDTWKKGLAA